MSNYTRPPSMVRPTAVLVAAAALLSVAGTQAHAAVPSGQVATLTPSHASGDIDGDGGTDHVFGYPSWNGGRGAIVVVTANGNATQLTADYPFAADYFGDSVSVGDIDGDGFEDVVVGVPGDWVGWSANAGSIHVFYGSTEGLTTVGDQLLTRNSAGIDSTTAASGDRFGETVAVADFNCDGYEDVAIGAPLDNAHPGRTDDGSINVIYGNAGGLSTVDYMYHQGTSQVSGAPESGDQFGGSLAVGNFNGDDYNGTACMDLAVGSPGEGADRGYAVFFYGHRNSPWWDLDFANGTGLSQNTSGAGGTPESNDVFGAIMWPYHDGGAHDDLLVGVPGEVCNDGTEGGLHRFWGTDDGFVVGGSLVNSLDQLQCVDWNDVGVQANFIDYEDCLDQSRVDCLADSEALLDSDGLLNFASTTAACLNAIEVASDRCEHWILDPVCDIDACIAATLELNTVANECVLEGDILTHAY